MTSKKAQDFFVRIVQDTVTLDKLTDEEKLLIFKFRTTTEVEKDALMQALNIFYKRHLEESMEHTRQKLHLVK